MITVGNLAQNGGKRVGDYINAKALMLPKRYNLELKGVGLGTRTHEGVKGRERLDSSFPVTTALPAAVNRSAEGDAEGSDPYPEDINIESFTQGSEHENQVRSETNVPSGMRLTADKNQDCTPSQPVTSEQRVKKKSPSITLVVINRRVSTGVPFKR